MARQFISLPVKLPNMENGLVIFILAVQIGATIVFAQQLYGQVPGDKAQGGCAQPQEQKVAEVQGIYDPVQGNMKVHD